MEQAILEDRNYEPKKEDFIDKIPETIPEGESHSQGEHRSLPSVLLEDESMGKEGDKEKGSSTYSLHLHPRTHDMIVLGISDQDVHRGGPPSISPVPLDQEVLPPAGVERETFIQQARTDVTRINELITSIANVFNLEPVYVELMKEDGEKLKTRDELFRESYDALESQFA